MNKILHGPNIAGQSLADRVAAAKFSIAGQGLAKSVAKATTEEVMGPKKKHLDYLLKCTNEPNVSIPQLANLLIERTQNSNWVVVFKSLVTIHNLMNYGNERFTQYLASNNCTFNLNTFLDKAGVQGYDMSTYIRRYAKYLNEKAYSYRTMAFDFCKVKRGKEDGLLRTMNTDKLLKTLPVLQQQVDALLEFDVSPNELTNGVINACFMLLFKDLIRLFACYNDGIINLLEKYFEMTKKQCREALDLYKRFLVRMERTSEFLKVCETVGIDKGDIPDLAKAPSSLLEALEEHLKSLESAKKTGQPAPKVAAKITSEINTFAAAATSGVNAAVISDEEKRRILEEESKQLEQLKEQKLKESPTSSAPSTTTNPFSTTTAATSQPSADPFGAGSPTSDATKPSDDLLGLSGPAVNPFAPPAAPTNNPFAPPSSVANSVSAGSPWGSPSIPASTSPQPSSLQDNLDPFGPSSSEISATPSLTALDLGLTSTPPMPRSASPSDVVHCRTPMFVDSSGDPRFDAFGDILQPASQAPTTTTTSQKLIQGDLDSSLASLAGNLSINPSQQVKKTDHQWNQMGASSANKMTAGSSPAWAAPAPSTMPSYNQPMAMGAPAVGGIPPMGAQPGFQQPAMMGRFPQPLQPVAGMPRPAGVGMAPPAGGAAMFGQPLAPTAQPTGFTAPSQASGANDPFGAL